MTACGGKVSETDGVRWDETAGGRFVKTRPVIESGKGRQKKIFRGYGRIRRNLVRSMGSCDQPAFCWR